MRLIACVTRVVWCGVVAMTATRAMATVVVVTVVMTACGVVDAMVWLVILLNMILIIILGCVGYGVMLFCGYAQILHALP